MRTLLLTCCLFAIAVGCTCSPANPSPVQLAVVNVTPDPLFVDDSRGQLGVTVQRNVGGAWFGFDDEPCECRTCARICDDTCTCGDGGTTGFVQRFEAGERRERTWNGVVQVSGTRSCFGESRPCLEPENAPLNETFRVELCYATQVDPSFAPDDGGRGPLEFPADGVNCASREFQPRDGVVEVGPSRGAACTTTADCKGSDELCFSGACTTGCPANDFPRLGSNWSLQISSPEDTGFFTVTPRTDGPGTLYTGTGTISSVLYTGTTLQVRLTRKGAANETLNGALFVTLPPGLSAPLVQGTGVTARLVDADEKENRGNRAVLLKDSTSGAILFAADVAQDGRLLADADLAPFAVAFGDEVVGCSVDQCGKQRFTRTRFTSGGTTVELDPGDAAPLNTAQGTYRALNVSSGSYPTALCNLTEVRPWALWRERP